MDVDDYARRALYPDRRPVRTAIHAAARELAVALAPEDAPLCDPEDGTAAPHEQARTHLALLHALSLAARELEELRVQAAHDAGATGVAGTTITYADLGRAAGITKQAARHRWPSAVPGARPGRPGRPPLPATETAQEANG